MFLRRVVAVLDMRLVIITMMETTMATMTMQSL